jgi:hypothetical protein
MPVDKPTLQKSKRAVSANAPREYSDNKAEILRILTNYYFLE